MMTETSPDATIDATVKDLREAVFETLVEHKLSLSEGLLALGVVIGDVLLYVGNEVRLSRVETVRLAEQWCKTLIAGVIHYPPFDKTQEN